MPNDQPVGQLALYPYYLPVNPIGVAIVALVIGLGIGVLLTWAVLRARRAEPSPTFEVAEPVVPAGVAEVLMVLPAAGVVVGPHDEVLEANAAARSLGLVRGSRINVPEVLQLVRLVRREQGTLRWEVVRQALWLRAPRSPKTGRRGGRLWLVVIPLIIAFGIVHALPSIPAPDDRDLGEFIASDAGKDFLEGAWGWYLVILIGFVFNTFLGEELLFRGLLLPRMNGAFGRGDWVANGVIFTGYHLHVPWAMPLTLLDMFTIVYPTKRYQSAWIGIIVHSAQSVVLGIVVLTLVL